MIENLQQHLDQLDEVGYTIFPDFMDKTMTARVREHIDTLDPPEKEKRNIMRHPIPGAIMAEILANPRLLELAKATLRATELRLLEQVLIRTDQKPPPYGASRWHVDWAFFPHQYEATPRQTYFHMVQLLSTVEPGGGALMIVPRSHKKTYAVTAKMSTQEELQTFRQDPIGMAGIDLDEAIEVLGNEGDLIVFNPMCLHSPSNNANPQPRYVYFSSFLVPGTLLHKQVEEEGQFDIFPDSLRDNLPQELRVLLDK